MLAVADVALPASEVFLEVKEVARLLRRAETTITSWCRKGLHGPFPGAIQPGRHWLIPACDVAAMTSAAAA